MNYVATKHTDIVNAPTQGPFRACERIVPINAGNKADMRLNCRRRCQSPQYFKRVMPSSVKQLSKGLFGHANSVMTICEQVISRILGVRWKWYDAYIDCNNPFAINETVKTVIHCDVVGECRTS
jgi:hypothetical protein